MSNFLAEGDVVREFEASLSAYSGGKGAAAVSTGTLVLHLALEARAVLCDVSLDDYNILPDEVKRKITRK